MTRVQDQITFIFSPGTGCYYPQLSKYCNHVEFNSPFNSDKLVKLQHPRCCPVIGSDYYIVQYPEIDVETPFVSPVHYMFIRHLSLWQGKYTPHPLYCNFVRMTRFNLSQDDDIEALNKCYEKCMKEKKNGKPLVMYGSSRGASTMITWYSKYKNTIKGIDALVLEGCPSSIDDICDYSPNWVNLCRKALLSSFTQYSDIGIKPVDCLLDLPKNIPIYFIASVKDEIVPYECSEKMVKILRDNGYSNIRLITLKEAPHSGYITHNSEDRCVYHDALQELYKQLLSKDGVKSIEVS